MKTHRFWFLPAVATLAVLTLGACSKTDTPSAGTGSAMGTGSATGAGPSTGTGPATSAAQPTDADVTTRVKTALLGDQALRSLDIAVVTNKGDVRMTGVVDTPEQAERAKKLAGNVEGVNAVRDELTVKK